MLTFTCLPLHVEQAIFRLTDRLQLQIKGVLLTQSLLLNVKEEFTHIERGNNFAIAKSKLALLIPIFHFEFCLKTSLKAVNKCCQQ